MYHLPHVSPKKPFYSGIQPKLIASSLSGRNQKTMEIGIGRLVALQSAHFVDIP